MKNGFTLIRKEADTYRSQGLHEEALELYAKFIVRSAKIDPATKYFIKKQVQLIEAEMNRDDSGAIQELPADRSNLIKDGGGKRTIESALFLCAQDQAQPPGRNQQDETDFGGADRLDPLTDIYALVSNDKGKGCPFSENFNGKAILTDPDDSKMLLTKDSPNLNRFHSDYTVKSFIKGIVAFVLAGSVFLYFIDWLSEVRRDRSGEAVQEAPANVLKRMPAIVSKGDTFTLPNNGMEDLSAKEEAVIGDAQPAVDPAETHEMIKNLLSTTNDNKTVDKTQNSDFQKDGTDRSEMPPIENAHIGTPPAEPDPVSVIDYVLKKRGL